MHVTHPARAVAFAVLTLVPAHLLAAEPAPPSPSSPPSESAPADSTQEPAGGSVDSTPTGPAASARATGSTPVAETETGEPASEELETAPMDADERAHDAKAAAPTDATGPASDAAAPTTASASERSAEEPGARAEVNLDVQLATAYVFRGWNVFQAESQMDPHLLLAPSLALAVSGTGFSVGYWAAYQLTGANIGANVDAGLGAEQDLYASYEHELVEDLTLAVRFFAYLYPAADRAVAGASVPMFFEPIVALSWSMAVDLGLQVTYMSGLQHAPSISGASYLYLNPSVGRSFPLDELVSLDLQLGYGLKVYKEGNAGRSNVHDLLFSAGLPVSPGGGDATVRPSVAIAWTNVEDAVDEESGDLLDATTWSDGIVAWASINVGMDL